MGGIARTEESWKTLSANHVHKEIFLGRAVVGEFKTNTSPGEGKKFVIDMTKIDEQAEKLKLKITGAQVQEEFQKRMAQ